MHCQLKEEVKRVSEKLYGVDQFYPGDFAQILTGVYIKNNKLNLPASKHRGRTNTRNLFRPREPDQLWQTDITYITTESGMNYLMCINDCFTKEWQGYHTICGECCSPGIQWNSSGRSGTEDRQWSPVYLEGVQECHEITGDQAGIYTETHSGR